MHRGKGLDLANFHWLMLVKRYPITN